MITVNVNLKETYSIEGKVSMVLFDGTVESEFFNGTILPGGVDTQTTDEKGWHLSARYMVDGVDSDGVPTRIFIQNNGEMENGEVVTHPLIIANNPKLEWLATTPMRGRIEPAEKGIRIIITQEVKHA